MLVRQIQTLLTRILLQGRAAELLKADEGLIEIDTYMRRMNFLPDPQEQLARLEPGTRMAMDAYVSGFNHWMVRKAVFVASIPNVGDMITPDFENIDLALRAAVSASETGDGHIIDPWEKALSGDLLPSANQYTIEASRIPEFMWCHNYERSKHVLNYKGWEDGRVHYSCSSYAISGDGSVAPSIFAEVSVWQDYTNWLSLPVSYYTGDSVHLTGVSTIENHYPLYLDDKLW